jgi:flagellar biosynthesis protein FliP
MRQILVLALALCAATAAPASAQDAVEAAFGVIAASDPAPAVAAEPFGPALPAGDDTGELARAVQGLEQGRLSTAVEIAVLITVLTLLPAILITVTSFTRIVIVLSFVRRALSTNELPPTQVVIGLSLFLTSFVMAPVAERIHDKAWVPYRAGEIGLEQAGALAWEDMGGFLIANTRTSELDLFAELAQYEPQAEDERPPLRVLVPAFVLSELKTSFQMGFLLFLPFLVIDMVVASVLLSMGMFMLPPVMVSTPFKILLFVLVDGWHLVCESLVTSFVTT